jgi:DNA helicase-2/ATP-dependent DNA helicase PcrA
MLVGDPKQAIYGFNGASSDFMLKHFIQDFEVPKENKFELTENYRLSKQIIAAANRLQPSTMQENQAVNGEVKALSFPNEDAEADWVINRLQTLIREGHQDIEGTIYWENCAVLGRTRYVMKTLETKLKQHNIPYYYKRTMDAIETESELIRCFELGMYLLINPQNRLHFQKLLELLNLEIDEQSWQDGFDMLTWIAKYLPKNPYFKILLTAWEYLIGSEIRFGKAIKVLKEYAIETWHDEERAMVCNDLKMWEKNWQSYLRQTNNKQRNLSSFLTQVALGATHQSQRNGLALLSVHTSKGLEFEVVCIIGMCERTFPDYRAIKGGGKFLEEEEHNAYVALTRSKRLAYLSYPRQKYMPWGEIKPQQASRYLQKMELEIITVPN